MLTKSYKRIIMYKKLSSLLLFAGAFACFPLAGQAQVIYKNSAYQWKANEFVQGKFKAKALSPTEMVSNYKPNENAEIKGMPEMPGVIDREHWVLKQDISKLPHYQADNVLENAIYNMTLEESILAVEPDNTFRTGVFWGGVWTRDVSYSILHALAQLNPEVSMTSLLAKVNNNNRIIQDTGTGGAWPCSTDRTTWILAAWECYKVTGDKEFLDRIYPVIKNTIEDDRVVAFDPKTQLMKGETSYLDWREQEYPVWAQPADIYNSETLGTNAVHCQTIHILAEICKLEGQPELAKKYQSWSDQIKEGINKHLWMADKGYYGIYLYGRNHLMLHPQMETLGEAFTIMFGIADDARAKQIVQNVEHEAFGTPMMYPNLKDQYPYHNDSMWPFVQGYWMKAVAKAGNEQSLLHSIASIYRTAAMFLTNQENMVIYNGDYKGLPINSPRQLWSVAADAAIVPNIYFGINYEVDGIHFTPFVPKALKGNRHLSNFKYRKAVLDMTISGFGNHLKSFKLDGVETSPFFAANLTGAHTIVMELDNVQPAAMNMKMVENAYMPLTPKAVLNGNQLSWQAVENAAEYIVLKDGKEMSKTTALNVAVPSDGEYAIVAVDADGRHSYMSEPVNHYSQVLTYEVEDFAMPFNPKRKQIKESMGTGGGLPSEAHDRASVPTLEGVNISGASKNVAMITRNENILITIPVEVPADGMYAIDWRYANGNGPLNTDNKCATRVLTVDGKAAGVSVFPQRVADNNARGEKKLEEPWNLWGYSNAQVVQLNKGQHVITLEFADCVENMNITVNQALLDQLRITKL